MLIKHKTFPRLTIGYSRRKVAPFEWNDDHVDENGNRLNVIQSAPPQGMFKVTNLFIDPATQKLAVQYDDET